MVTPEQQGRRRPLTRSPIRWRVLWQLGPLDQGAEGLDVLANFFHGSVSNSSGDLPFTISKKNKNESSYLTEW